MAQQRGNTEIGGVPVMPQRGTEAGPKTPRHAFFQSITSFLVAGIAAWCFGGHHNQGWGKQAATNATATPVRIDVRKKVVSPAATTAAGRQQVPCARGKKVEATSAAPYAIAMLT